ncbi:threonine--tRNA ligase [Fictibacillus sp. KIGAM418]|uniref:Threonine--tRNA ligase n=1 Tax=Fictibacillus marinisediminis TaxID=2878389 RepID=A0A9X1XA99_9BACL|nr:threonine--tRNA ligase [Fictibacillus marinisediminis]MCK6256486.1 threonine--tRNA ligase [Fictibacillus marinisediminis]
MKENQISIQFPDGSEKKYPYGVSMDEIAASISPGLKKKAAAGRIDNVLYDLSFSLERAAAVEILTLDSDEGINIMRHSAAHVLAQAVQRLYDNVKLGVGPVIENGFYYDMDVPVSITLEDLPAIEAEMNKIIKENKKIERIEVSRGEAEEYWRGKGDHLKLELLNGIPDDEEITFYKQGEFMDLCRGPHLPSTGLIKAFKLTSVSGAYWRGDSENQMLQRIYGVAFSSKKELEEHLLFLEEAAKRDHRKLGKELDLFMFSEEAPGMPFFLPKGQLLRNELERFLREFQMSHSFEEVRTPLMLNQRLWEQSGHWDHYKENMYFSQVDQAGFALKPMNCPGHMLIYKNKRRSYRDLPLRLAEFGQVHRHEFSGALNGLLRVRTFCQDDAHIFVAPDQIESELESVLDVVGEVYRTFGFQFEVELSTRPEDSMGDERLWEKAENALENVLKKAGLNYRINEGDGAFYGPKIDFHIRDAINRSHQCATVQLDFQMPEKFDLHYIDEKNEKQRPVVIHRAILGSIDRFLGILIEHYAGAFPLWLAPVQVKVLPVSLLHHQPYAEDVVQRLKSAGIRVEADVREEKLGYKIRGAQLQKIPFILVVGDEEIKRQGVNARKYGEESSGFIEVEQLIKQLQEKVENRQ